MINKDKIQNVVIQFVKFGIVGVSNTIISLIVYYILILIDINYIIANTCGFICSVINAYYWNSKYVFKTNKEESRNTAISFIKVFTSYLATFLLGTGLLFFWIEVLKISNIFAPLFNLVITIPLNFILNKFWAMK